MLVGDSLGDKALYLMFGVFQEESLRGFFLKSHTQPKIKYLKIMSFRWFYIECDCLFIFEKKKDTLAFE